MKALLLVVLFSIQSAFALTITDLLKDRGAYGEKEIELEGIIRKLKHHEKKYDDYYQFQIIDKFNKEFVKAKFYVKYHDETINKTFDCKEGQVIKVKGNFYAKPKGKNLGELLVQKTVQHQCIEDNSFEKIKKTYNIENLKTDKKNLDKKHIKVTGFVYNLRMSLSAKKTKASFKLVDSTKKTSIKVSVLVALGEDRIINDFKCKEGQVITLSGAFQANMKAKKRIGEIDIISKEFIKCDENSGITLSAKDKHNLKKNKIREQSQRLSILFKKFKKYYKSKKNKFIQSEFNAVYDEMRAICKEGINHPKLNLKCVKISYYARTMEQRNQISFRIQSTMNNFPEWKSLTSYKLPEKNNILEIIKALYPNNSDYIIGIPKRCFPDQQFNPSASNFPYRKLGVSKYAKDNFTAILHKFNDPALKCGSVMDSIFFIGNMDSDNELEVLKVDTYEDKLYKVINSDI